MLVIDSFTKRYHDKEILSFGKLMLSKGVHLIKGENGSGKSTMFKCLAGILPFKGEVTLDSHRLHRDPVAYRYHVSFAEAEPLYPDFLTARDLMRFVGKTRQTSHGQLEHYRDRLGVDEFYTKSCGTYSSGMLKKLSLSLAFLGNPRMIILDEPLITLDEESRGKLFRLINEMPETIFLISSHQSIDHHDVNITSVFRIESKTLLLEQRN